VLRPSRERLLVGQSFWPRAEPPIDAGHIVHRRFDQSGQNVQMLSIEPGDRDEVLWNHGSPPFKRVGRENPRQVAQPNG
jgi:hypothetical protein